MTDYKDSHQPDLARREHDEKNVGAKKVSVWAYDADSDSLQRIGGVDAGDGTFGIQALGGLVPKKYDHLTLTYVASGNGVGEIETVTYRDGGSGGTTVATLTLTYNANGDIITIART